MFRTRVGYAGGTKDEPVYRDLGDHAEALQVDFDPNVIGYDALLAMFWQSHRPTHPDRASQYRSAVLTADAPQLEAATKSFEVAQVEAGRPLYSQIEPLGRFWLAEDYHQKYRLGRVPGVRAELWQIYPQVDRFADSTAAMRINAYLGGHRSPAQLAEEIETFGLTPTAQRELRQAVESRRG